MENRRERAISRRRDSGKKARYRIRGKVSFVFSSVRLLASAVVSGLLKALFLLIAFTHAAEESVRILASVSLSLSLPPSDGPTTSRPNSLLVRPEISLSRFATRLSPAAARRSHSSQPSLPFPSSRLLGMQCTNGMHEPVALKVKNATLSLSLSLSLSLCEGARTISSTALPKIADDSPVHLPFHLGQL